MMDKFNLIKSIFILCLLFEKSQTCFPWKRPTTPRPLQTTTPSGISTTSSSTQELQTTATKPIFLEWGCINERTVKNTAELSTKFKINSTYVSTIHECSLRCDVKGYGYMVFREKLAGVKMENCHCIGINTDDFKVYPSDIESALWSDTSRIKCEKNTSFLLSCRHDSGNWCERLDQNLENDPVYNIDPEKGYLWPFSNFFPKCLANNDILNENIHFTSQNIDQDDPWRTCKTNCNYTTYSIMSKNANNESMCLCANITAFEAKSEKTEQFVIQHDCDKIPQFGKDKNQKYNIYTSGKYSKIQSEKRFSVYCRETGNPTIGGDRNCHTYNSQMGNKFSYFGCVRKPNGLNEQKTTTPKNCIEYCNNNQNMTIALIKYINSTHSHCICLPEPSKNENQANITIRNISNGCEESWCPDLGGPCGSIQSLNESDGYSLYCQTSPKWSDTWTEITSNDKNYKYNVCKQIAKASTFYPLQYPTTSAPITTTTTHTTTITTKSSTTSSSIMTTPTTTLTTITTATSTTTLPTTTTATATMTTTLTTTTTPITTATIPTKTTATTPVTLAPCVSCAERNDSRGYYWNQTCSGNSLNFDYCPENTTGHATWYCVNGQFYPEQPDRTNCIAQWVDDVVEQAQDENSSAFNITNIILNHTSNSNVEITSGTLIKLIEVGLNLSTSCNWNKVDDNQVNTTSRLITRYYVQITSDLFTKELSWREMNFTDQAKYATKLMKSMEGIAYRHLYGISNTTLLPTHIQDNIGDNRSQVKIYMAVIRKDQKIDASMIPPEITLPASMSSMDMQDQSFLHTSLFGATYNFSILRDTLMSADRFSQYKDTGNTLVLNSKPAMTSLSINNKPSYIFNGSRATITFKHDNNSLACQDCKRWCVYWDESIHQWSDHGITVETDSNAWHTTCKTDHLTNFAVIFDFTGVHFSGVEEAVLEILSLVFCSVSCLCALLTLIILNISRLPISPRIAIVKHRSFCLFMLYLLFLVGLDPSKILIIFSKSSELCTAAGIMIHFFGLAVFSWTLLEGHHLNSSLQATRLDVDGKYTMLLRYVFGYGAPLAILALTLATGYILDEDGAYIQSPTKLELNITNADSSEYGVCFLNKESFMYFFIIPAALMIIFNSVVFIKAFKAVQQAKKSLNVSSAMSTFIQIKSWFMLNFLLGITWATGFLFNLPHMQDVAFAFVILNGSSGMFIFFHTILLNEPIMTEIKVFLGFLDKESFGINHGVHRAHAFKSFKAPIYPRLNKNDSTSSEEAPPKVTRFRKKRPRTTETSNVEHRNYKNWVVSYHTRDARQNSSISQPEDTSITSSFSSGSSGSSCLGKRYYEEKKPVKRYNEDKKPRKRQVEWEEKIPWKREVEWAMAALPEESSQQVLKHERIQQLKQARIGQGHRHSNKW